MKQQSLFGNLPQLNQQTKELNKAIVDKVKAPKKTRTTTVKGNSNKGATTIAKRVQTVIEVLKQRLVDTGEYEVIRTSEQFLSFMEKVRKNGIAALDTEATGLDPIDDHVVGIGIYTPGSKAVYIPTGHTDFQGNLVQNQVTEDEVREQFNLSEAVKWVFHNAKFDMRMMRNTFKLNNYLKCHWDTSLASNFLNENEPHGLKALWKKYVSKNEEDTADTFDTLFDKIPYNYIPIEYAYIYGAKDPKITWELYEFQIQHLNDSEDAKKRDLYDMYKLLTEIEIPLIPILCEMEDTGISIDEKFANSLADLYNKQLEGVMERFIEYTNDFDLSTLPAEKRSKLGTTINIGSPTQLAIIIYDYLKLNSVDRRSPRGTGEEVLIKLADRYPEHQKFFSIILEYRGLAKLLSTYVEKMPRIVKEKTGKLHGQFNQYGAKTGRFSSSDPNLQNIPSKNKEIRKMFTASEGYALIGGDFSQQEPRVLAHLCFVLFDDNKMMQAYLDGKDLYAWMAAEVYKVEYDECKEFRPDGSKNPEGKKRRDSVKSILLGLMYGRSTKSIGEQMGVNEEQAQKIVDMLFNTFPGINEVILYFMRLVREKGYTKTIWGRKRRLPEYNLPKYDFVKVDDRTQPIEDENIRKYYWTRMDNAWSNKLKTEVKNDARANGVHIVENDFKISETERQILNSVIQGSSADITKKAMLMVGEDEQLKQLGFRLLLTVHDELIGESPKETAKQCKERMQELMLQSTADKIVVPMSVDCELTDRWYGEDIEHLIA